MADVAGLGIKIDSTEAKKGADEVIRAMQGILDEAKKVTNGVDSTGQSFDKLKKGGGIIATLKEHWMALTGAVFAAGIAVKGAWDMMAQEGRHAAMTRGMDVLLEKYKMTGDELSRQIQRAAKDTISLDEAIALASKGTAMGLDPAKLTELAKYAKVASAMMGNTFSEAVEKIEMAAMTGAKRATRALGIVPDFNKFIEAYQYKIGKQKESMEQDELAEARMDAMLEAMKDRYGEMGSLADPILQKQKQMVAGWEDFKDKVGGAMLGSLNKILGVTNEWGVVLTGVVATGLTFLALKAGAAALAVYSTSGAVGVLNAAMLRLHLTMLKNPLFWIAMILGAAAAAWYKYNQGVEAAEEAQKAYNVSLKTMPADQLAEETEKITARLRELGDEYNRLKELQKGEATTPGKFDFMIPTKPMSNASVGEMKKVEAERAKLLASLGVIEDQQGRLNADNEKKRLAAKVDDIKSAQKSIDELYQQSLSKQADTEGAFQKAKITELETKYSLHFDELSDLHRKKFLEIIHKEWVNTVEKAQEEVRLKISAANRQMASDMDAALSAAGKLDEGEALGRKYTRDTEALKEALKVQQDLIAKAETPKPEKIKAAGEVSIIEKQLAQKPKEEALVREALATKTAATIRDIEIAAMKEINAAADALNTERAAAGLMTEREAIEQRYAARKQEIATEIDSLEVAHGQTATLLEQLKIEAEINKLERERRNLPAMKPFELAKSDLRTAQSVAAAREATLAGARTRVDMEEMRYEITKSDAAKKRIAILEEEKSIKEELLAKLPKGSADEITAWNNQAAAVEAVNKQLLEQEQLLQNRDAIGGARRAFMEYADSAMNYGEQIGNAITTVMKGMEDAMVEFTTKGKFDFRTFADSVIADLVRIATRAAITGPLSSALGTYLSGLMNPGAGGGVAGTAENSALAMDASHAGAYGLARGGAFDSRSNVIPFRRGGVVSQQSMFRFARGTGMMSEGGRAEAIMPLSRLPSGDLGVKSSGASDSSKPQSVRVEIVNRSGKDVKASQAETQFDMQGMVLSIVLDAAERDVMGFRTMLERRP